MKSKFLLFAVSVALLTGACKKKDDPEVVLNPNYALEVRNTGFDVIGLHPVEDITSGQAEMNGASEALFSFYVGDWDANGAIYSRDYSPNKFSKFEVVNGSMQLTQSLPIPGNFDAEANVRLDQDKVWFVRTIDNDTVYWDVVNTTTMSYVSSGKFGLPLKSGYKLKSGFTNKLGRDLVFGYHQVKDDATAEADSVYIAVLDGTNYTVKSIDSDERSAAAGYTYSSSSFTAENGDVYFLTYPFAYVGNNPSKPSAIMRIKNGETTIDDSYFFNVTSSTGDNNLNGPSIYMGNNKLLVQIVVEDLVENGDYWGASENGIFQNEYYVLDLSTKTASKLNVPLSRGNGDGNPIKVGTDLYAFIVNGADGNFVYTYNVSTGEVKQGLKYIGALVIYKLHSLEK